MRRERAQAPGERSRSSSPSGSSPGPGRRSYARPRILSREALEAVAAVCAPTPPAKGNPGVCPSGPISS
jgi:hypothetical protein